MSERFASVGAGRRVRRARTHDGPALLELLEQRATPGGFTVLYTRRPDPYASYTSEHPQVELTVSEDKRGLVDAQLAVIPQEIYLQHTLCKVGYLTGLERREGSLAPLPELLRFAWEQSDCRELYCSVLGQNDPAQTLFQKPRRALPTLQQFCSYRTYLVGPRALMRLQRGRGLPSIEVCSSPSQAELQTFYRQHAPQHAGFPSVEPLDTYAHLCSDDFYALKVNDELVAACALWDQRSYKQYVVTQYKGAYRVATRLGALLQMLGYFPLPQKGTVAPCIHVSFLLAEEESPHFLACLLAHLGKELLAQGSFACIGAAQGSPLDQLLSKLPAISFPSTLLGTPALLEGVIDPAKSAFQCALL